MNSVAYIFRQPYHHDGDADVGKPRYGGFGQSRGFQGTEFDSSVERVPVHTVPRFLHDCPPEYAYRYDE